jgi:catechol 2,3-dioxygenase-like lactoylglutathione lyase family enzyme
MSGVRRLDHINILTRDMERTREFLMTVLGLEEGPRPAFRSPGYWLYADGHPVVHISDASNKERTHVVETALGDARRGGTKGIVDHVAFRCSGYAAVMTKLRDLGIATHEADIPGTKDRQVFIDGPDDVSFELIFTADDVAAARQQIAAST